MEDVDEMPQLVLKAIKDIDKGDFIDYNYNERSKDESTKWLDV